MLLASRSFSSSSCSSFATSLGPSCVGPDDREGGGKLRPWWKLSWTPPRPEGGEDLGESSLPVPTKRSTAKGAKGFDTKQRVDGKAEGSEEAVDPPRLSEQGESACTDQTRSSRRRPGLARCKDSRVTLNLDLGWTRE